MLGKAAVRCGRINLSRILTTGESKEIGLYDEPSPTGFPGFRIGMITANFQIAGMSAFWIERLNKEVMKSIALLPRFFK